MGTGIHTVKNKVGEDPALIETSHRQKLSKIIKRQYNYRDISSKK